MINELSEIKGREREGGKKAAREVGQERERGSE